MGAIHSWHSNTIGLYSNNKKSCNIHQQKNPKHILNSNPKSNGINVTPDKNSKNYAAASGRL